LSHGPWGYGLFAVPAAGANFEFKGKIDAQDPTSRLLAYYIQEFSPEKLSLSIDEQPDETGRFRDIYMDLTGVLIEGIRLEKLTFRMVDAQFNNPAQWASGEVECESALQIYAQCLLKEEDINRKLATETFGDDDHWKNISMKISPSGLYANGTYTAKIFFVTLNILLEVESGLRIVDNKELWLEDYKVRVNSLSVPDYITKKALSQIQPLLNLGRFPLPLKLHRIAFQEGQALLSTRVLPQPPEDGITYHYVAE
jgi:hypothetical protein